MVESEIFMSVWIIKHNNSETALLNKPWKPV